ncbi:hypothetical protein Q6294_31660, partial [Klebsiella pneumoniae]
SLALKNESSDIRRHKILFVICSAVSCQGFLRARNHLRLKKQTLRGATTMHEIPNLPFPSDLPAGHRQPASSRGLPP